MRSVVLTTGLLAVASAVGAEALLVNTLALDSFAGQPAALAGAAALAATGTWLVARRKLAAAVGDRVGRLHSSRRQLREVTRQQRAILDGAHYAIISTDAHGMIRSMNRAACHMLGYDEAELRARHTPALFHDPEEVANRARELSEELGELIAPGFEVFALKSRFDASEERQWTYIDKQGRRFPVLLSVTALKDEAGAISGYLGIASDISARIEAEQALQKEERRYRTLIESAGDGILLWRNGFFADCNSATLTLFACEREQILGVPSWRISPERQPDGRLSIDEARQRIAATLAGEPQFFQWRYERANGESFDAEVTMNRLDDDPTCFVAIIRDITARKRQETEIRDQKDLLQSTMEAAPGLFMVFDANGLPRRWNHQVETVLEVSNEALKHLDIRSLIHPDDQQHTREKIRLIIEEGRTETTEVRLVSTSGKVIPVLATGSRAMLENAPQVVCFAMDLSIRKLMEKELQDFQLELIQRNDSLRLINLLSSHLNGLLNIDTIASETVDILQMFGRCHVSALYLRRDDAPVLELAASGGMDIDDRIRYRMLPVTTSILGRIMIQGVIRHLSELQEEARANAEVRDFIERHEIGDGALIPLLSYGKPIGIISLYYRSTSALERLHSDTLEAIGRTLSLAISNARHFNDLEHQAHHDSLTDLPNRKLLHETFDALLNERQHTPGSIALLLLDLNRFKEVNDTLGHHTGDILLKQTSQRLVHVASTHQTLVCRLGGDEFAVLVYGVSDESQVVELGERIGMTLRKPFMIDGKNLQIGASIGAAFYPQHGNDSHALLRAADVAMYRAKQRVLEVVVYDRQSDTHSPERLSIISDLSQAIHDRQLVLHYQPKLALDQKTVTGFEALVRWQHPLLGFLYPDAFVPVAEQGDAILGLTRSVLEMALAQQQQWKRLGFCFSVAVNLSARNLLDGRIVELIAELMQRFDTRQGELELEITETALMQDPEFAAGLLHRIADLGVTLSIDDFGTGYSSLGYLRHLPISSLKIDRLFVKDMLKNEQDAIIVRSTIGLAHNLSMQVIAEGVEDAATCEALEEMGCDVAQGYYLSEPRSWQDIESWLDDLHIISTGAPGRTVS